MSIEQLLSEKNKSKAWVPGKDLVHYSGPYFDEKEYVAAIQSLLDGFLVLGKEGIKFEKNFPSELGKKYGILTNSGSSANLLMLAVLASKNGYNLPKGTKVITPIAGFPTTVNPILQVGFEPVFVDIEMDTLNLDLDQVEEKLKNDPDIKALIFAHVLGNPPNMNRLMELVKKYNLILLEDCCDALGSMYEDKLLGSFGDLASCSFYPAHHITMGEGGFVACNDPKIEKTLRSLRDWGRDCYCQGKANESENGSCKKRFSNWLPDLHSEIVDHKYVYSEIGYNLKPIEMQAAIGNVQLKKLDEIITLRKRNYELLYNIFSKYENYFVIHEKQDLSDPSWFAFPVTISINDFFKRSDIVKWFEKHKIQTRQYFGGNLLLQPAYDKLSEKYDPVFDFPMATLCTTNTFFLGTSPVITAEQIEYIGEVLDNFMIMIKIKEEFYESSIFK